MKNKFIILALFLTISLSNKAFSQCPEYDGNGMWQGLVGGECTVNGCDIDFFYCFRINIETGFHEISVSEIWVDEPCDGTFYDNNSQLVNDSIMANIARGPIVTNPEPYGWGLEIPECPNNLCLLKIYDRICYNGWYQDSPEWKMKLCYDGGIRSCVSGTLFCWKIVDGVRITIVTHWGEPTGDKCPEGCSDNCN